MNTSRVDNEEEDVVIKDSPLYKHLYELGYNDFESITIEKLEQKNENKSFKFSDLLHYIKNAFKKLGFQCLKIIQDDSISKKHMEAILNAKILLNDHGTTINNFLDKYECKPWRAIISKYFLIGTVVSSSVYASYNTQYRSLASSFALSILYFTVYIEYVRIQAHTDLRTVVGLQNDLFDLCKKGMKILRYGYKMKLSKGKGFQPFSDLTADRLKYLQTITESLVRFLEHVSRTYYSASLILINLLPSNARNSDLLTRLETASFELHGEINYQKLKVLYHTYILTQSEMLHLFAIAYDNHTWEESGRKIPELKLAYIIRFLIVHLRKYRNELADIIDTYYNFRLEPVSYKYRGPDTSQWRDLYMHLYLASNKLQLAYGHILSVLQDIDNDAIENSVNEDCMENTMQRLSTAQKSLETAKDFVEFSTLFLVKTQTNNGNYDNRLEVDIPSAATKPEVRVVSDSEPEILDEVFEEYIKEEYLKPLIEDSDEITLYNHKRDKTLFKNFMAELKDALVDKQKSMSERETRALQRMYKALMNSPSTMVDRQEQRIPTPPPMPTFNSPAIIQEGEDSFNGGRKLGLKEFSANVTMAMTKSNENENHFRNEELDIFVQARLPSAGMPLSLNKEFSIRPPPFLKVEEETFVGSGENSEDEETDEAKTE